MITQNSDDHPLLKLMHRRDPKWPPHMQDKRTVAPLEKGDWDAWQHGTGVQAEALLQVPPLELFVHGTKASAKHVELFA